MPLHYAHLLVRKVSGGFNIYPPDKTTTDDLTIYANTTDVNPYLKINGAAGVAISLSGANVFRLDSSTGGMFCVWAYVAPDCRMYAANDINIFLDPQGTGKVKFGTYTAGAATDSTGYITILDAAGNTRKLMVQA